MLEADSREEENLSLLPTLARSKPFSVPNVNIRKNDVS